MADEYGQANESTDLSVPIRLSMQRRGGSVLPPRIRRKYVRELHARARLGHHGRDGIAPDLIVPGFQRAGGKHDSCDPGKFKVHVWQTNMEKRMNPLICLSPFVCQCNGVGVLSYHPASSGNTCANFTLVRGSAIMGATASRQT